MGHFKGTGKTQVVAYIFSVQDIIYITRVLGTLLKQANTRKVSQQNGLEVNVNGSTAQVDEAVLFEG